MSLNWIHFLIFEIFALMWKHKSSRLEDAISFIIPLRGNKNEGRNLTKTQVANIVYKSAVFRRTLICQRNKGNINETATGVIIFYLTKLKAGKEA